MRWGFDMQIDTTKPAAIKDLYTGAHYFLMRKDGRYHRRADDRGRWPSDFFNEFGHLKQQFKAA